jgi:hypothetical protein
MSFDPHDFNDVADLAGVHQRQQQQQSLNEQNRLLREQAAERARIGALPKCPACKTPLEHHPSKCPSCRDAIAWVADTAYTGVSNNAAFSSDAISQSHKYTTVVSAILPRLEQLLSEVVRFNNTPAAQTLDNDMATLRELIQRGADMDRMSSSAQSLHFKEWLRANNDYVDLAGCFIIGLLVCGCPSLTLFIQATALRDTQFVESIQWGCLALLLMFGLPIAGCLLIRHPYASRGLPQKHSHS